MKIHGIRNDLLFIVILIIPGLICGLFLLCREDGGTVRVSQNGEVRAEYSLAEDGIYTIPCSSGGYNTFVIADGEVYMQDADCPDRLCVKSGKISKDGQSIICLPHALTVEVIGGEENDVDMMSGEGQ